MEGLSEYKIAWRGLGQGTHRLEYVLDEAFFNSFDSTKGTEGQVTATVEIVKSSLLMEVNITLEGSVKAQCDRCLGWLDLPISGSMSLYAKQGAEESEEDDYIVLSPEDDYLDLSKYIYETYMLNYPIRVVHEDGGCDEKMEEWLERYVIEEDNKPTDPRWDELKKLINN